MKTLTHILGLAVLLHPDKTAVAGADEAFKALGVARRNILATM